MNMYKNLSSENSSTKMIRRRKAFSEPKYKNIIILCSYCKMKLDYKGSIRECVYDGQITKNTTVRGDWQNIQIYSCLNCHKMLSYSKFIQEETFHISSNGVVFENKNIRLENQFMTIYIGSIPKDICPDHDVMQKSILMYGNNEQLTIPAYQCSKCQGIVILKNRFQPIWKTCNPQYRFVFNVPGMTPDGLLLERELNTHTLLVRTNIFQCVKYKHKLQDIFAKIRIVHISGTTETLTIPAGYCADCDRYYILESEFEKVRHKGILVCKLTEYTKITSSIFRNAELQTESLLFMLGYNVNAKQNLSRKQRWTLLDIIIQEKIMTKMQIMSHLNSMLLMNMDRPSFDAAVAKWSEDLKYVSTYKDDSMREISVNEIIKTIYKKQPT